MLDLDEGDRPLGRQGGGRIGPLSRLCGHGEAIVVERVLGDPEPEIGIRQELLPRLVNLLEVQVLGGELVISLERCFVACV